MSTARLICVSSASMCRRKKFSCVPCDFQTIFVEVWFDFRISIIRSQTRDSVTVAVDAVVYYRIRNATVAVVNVADAARATRLLASTTLRNELGQKTLSELLSDREHISGAMQAALDEATDPWGIRVERVEM